MSNLSVFNKDGLEIIIDNDTGESFCSVSGYARMSGKDKSTISRRMGTVASTQSKTAEIQTVKGLRTVAIVSEDLISEWIVDDNPVIAKQLLRAGVRVYLHKAAGYKVSSEAIQPQPKSQAEIFLLIAQQMVEQERLTKELESRLTQFEQIRDEAIADLNTLEPPSVEAEELSTRAKIRRRVTDFVVAKGLGYQEAYAQLYREFRDRYHTDLRQRAKNSGKKKPLDIAEDLGLVEELYAVADDLFA
ncbi:hypothetical protein [Allocoleopsis sp.]|uniref:hypothetical protein n=1 Tax=Allocoleopsis sp. TaxID=3088169 RepID=UPI002FD37595